MQANSTRSISACACALAVAGVSTLITIAPTRAEPATADRSGVEPHTIDPSDIHSLRLDPEERRLPLRAASPQRRAADAPPLLTRGGGVDLLDAADQYDFFDGFETYELGPLSGQLMNAPLGVLTPVSQQHVHIVDTAAESLPHARDPFGTGNAQHLKNARGDTGMVSTQSETQWRLDFDRIFAPTTEREVIVCTDFFFPDLETLVTWETISFTEGVITTRVLQAGYWDRPSTDPTGGVLTRPAVLGPGFSSSFGVYYAVPLDTGTDGALAPFTTRTNEWFTIAVRLSENGFTIWIRDGQTDGSNGVLIEDPSGTPFFESGWYRLYPGRTAQESMPGVWTGYGNLSNSSFGEPPQFEQFIAGTAVDSVRSQWFPGNAIPDDPDWAPTNRHFDNVCIIGPSTAPCPWDLTGSGFVGSGDLGFLLGCWGPVTESTCAEADFTNSSAVGSDDLAAILGNWGPCPE